MGEKEAEKGGSNFYYIIRDYNLQNSSKKQW
jgi:hypothetical protein